MTSDSRELLLALKEQLTQTRADITTTANELSGIHHDMSCFVVANYMLQAAVKLGAAIQQIELEMRL